MSGRRAVAVPALCLLVPLFPPACAPSPSTAPSPVLSAAPSAARLPQAVAGRRDGEERGSASTADPPAAILGRSMQLRGKSVHLREAGPLDGPSVLLLHGQAFHSGTWEELGTLAYLAERGLRVVAVDAPGYGASEASGVTRERFLEELVPALGLRRPVIVAPSMAGSFAFPYLARHGGELAGFVGIAPAGSAEWARRLAPCAAPALIVWGTADSVFPVSDAEVLAGAFTDGRTLLLEGARHPAYLDRPEEFHAALADFVAERAR